VYAALEPMSCAVVSRAALRRLSRNRGPDL